MSLPRAVRFAPLWWGRHSCIWWGRHSCLSRVRERGMYSSPRADSEKLSFSPTSSRHLLLILQQLRHTLQHPQGISPHPHVVIALGQPSDLIDQLPPPDLPQHPQRRNPVLSPAIAQHVKELLPRRGNLHPTQRL